MVAKGFSQRAGIDYSETFSPVVQLNSIRLLLACGAEMDLDMVHFDAETAFLYGNHQQTIYLVQPLGCQKDDQRVSLLKKTLYGLKQPSRQWNLRFTRFLRRLHLKPLIKDNCIFTTTSRDTRNMLIIALHVDDGLICCNNRSSISEVVSNSRAKLQIKLMDLTCSVGLEIKRVRKSRCPFINRGFYASKMIGNLN